MTDLIDRARGRRRRGPGWRAPPSTHAGGAAARAGRRQHAISVLWLHFTLQPAQTSVHGRTVIPILLTRDAPPGPQASAVGAGIHTQVSSPKSVPPLRPPSVAGSVERH